MWYRIQDLQICGTSQSEVFANLFSLIREGEVLAVKLIENASGEVSVCDAVAGLSCLIAGVLPNSYSLSSTKDGDGLHVHDSQNPMEFCNINEVELPTKPISTLVIGDIIRLLTWAERTDIQNLKK